MAKNNKTRFFYVLYSDKTWVFDQSERAYYPIYIIKMGKGSDIGAEPPSIFLVPYPGREVSHENWYKQVDQGQIAIVKGKEAKRIDALTLRKG